MFSYADNIYCKSGRGKIMNDKYTILIVDDEQQIRDIIKQFLEINGNRVLEAEDGIQALKLIEEQGCADLVILDYSMPHMNGDEVCRQIREHSNCPVIFLTAYGDDETKRKCFEYGADDYLVKPFRYAELVMHVNALLRRCYQYNSISGKNEVSDKIGNLIIDRRKKKLECEGKDIGVTYTEFSIFEFLADNRGKTYSLGEIYENVWHEKYCEESANTVMVHIRNLRKKLDKTGEEYIFNKWGRGYYVN